MRKFLLVPAIFILVSAAAAESRLFLAAGASYLRPADERYRLVYGNQAICPELTAAIRLVGGLCLTGGAGRFSKNGTTPGLGWETRGTQSYFSIGLSYLLRASSTLCFEAGAGMAGLSFREEALGKWVRGKHPGFRAEGGILLVPEDERVFMGLKVGYMSARLSGADLDPIGDQPIRLGGFRVAVCVGIQLFGTN